MLTMISVLFQKWIRYKMQVRVKDKKDNGDDFGKCGCGRSPSGKCIGWHGLTEAEYLAKLAEYNVKDSEQGG
jgi:hypothetical protein